MDRVRECKVQYTPGYAFRECKMQYTLGYALLYFKHFSPWFMSKSILHLMFPCLMLIDFYLDACWFQRNCCAL